jgi:hypothetical protein
MVGGLLSSELACRACTRYNADTCEGNIMLTIEIVYCAV